MPAARKAPFSKPCRSNTNEPEIILNPPEIPANPLSFLKKNSFQLGLLVAAALVFWFYYHHQPVASYTLEPRMDGNQYAQMYAFFKSQIPAYQVKFPFNTRVLVPGLASLMPVQTPVPAFQLINFGFVMLTALALGRLWQKLQLPVRLRVMGFAWLLLHWSGLIRLNAFDPVAVDVPVYFFETLLLLIAVSRKWQHLLWLAPLATLNKEHFPALLLVLAGWAVWTKQSRPTLVVVLAACVLGLLTRQALPCFFPATGEGSALATLWRWMWLSITHPFRWVRWGVAFFMAFGVLVVPVVVAFFMKKQGHTTHAATGLPDSLLLCLAVASLGLGFLGGGDFTRLAFLGFPFVMTWLLQRLQYIPVNLIYLGCLLSLPFFRIFQSIPDPGTHWQDFIAWYPEFAQPGTVFGWGLYTLAAGGGLAVVMKLQKQG